MRRYETKVLGALLDKYESSLLYKGENKRKQRITYPVTKQVFPEYFDLSSLAYDELHEELLEMETQGLVVLHWKTRTGGHVLKDIELNLDSLERIYQMLGRTPRSGIEGRALEILREFDRVQDDVTEYAVRWFYKRIEAGESVKRYVNIENPEELRQLIASIHAVASNDKEMYVREFSTLHFHDSKKFKKMEGKILNMIRKFYRGSENGIEEFEDEQLLNLFGIYENPAFVVIKGTGLLNLGSLYSDGERKVNMVDLKYLPGGLGIHSQDLERVEFAEQTPVKRVMTVENLTVFHRINLPETLFLYLGGYHTVVRRRFLIKVYQEFPEAEYLHFGDMDCGGFKILEDLRNKTGIRFLPYRMDCDTYSRHEGYGQPLTQNDKNELMRMIGDERYKEYREILKRILASGKKLEQECIGLKGASAD